MKEASREQLRSAPLGALRQAMEVISNEIERNEEAIKSKRAGLAELKAVYFERLDGGEVEGDALSELEKLIKWGQGVSSKTYPTRSAPDPLHPWGRMNEAGERIPEDLPSAAGFVVVGIDINHDEPSKPSAEGRLLKDTEASSPQERARVRELVPPSSSPALCVLCEKREGSCCPLCNKGPYCQRCAEGEGLFCCDNGKPIAGGVQ